MFGLRFEELLLILLILLLLFGGKRISEISRGLGEALKEFRKGLNEKTDENLTNEKKSVTKKKKTKSR